MVLYSARKLDWVISLAIDFSFSLFLTFVFLFHRARWRPEGMEAWRVAATHCVVILLIHCLRCLVAVPAVPPHATPATLHHCRRRFHCSSHRPLHHSDHTAILSSLTRTAVSTPPHLPHPYCHSRHGHSCTAIALWRRDRIAVPFCESRRSHRSRGSGPQWQVFAVRHAR